MDEFTWVSVEVSDDGSIIIEHSGDISKDGIMSAIGDYKTEYINEQAFKIVTEMTLKQANKLQDTVSKRIEEKFFVLV